MTATTSKPGEDMTEERLDALLHPVTRLVMALKDSGFTVPEIKWALTPLMIDKHLSIYAEREAKRAVSFRSPHQNV